MAEDQDIRARLGQIRSDIRSALAYPMLGERDPEEMAAGVGAALLDLIDLIEGRRDETQEESFG